MGRSPQARQLTRPQPLRAGIVDNLRSLRVGQLAAVNLRLPDDGRVDARFDDQLAASDLDGIGKTQPGSWARAAAIMIRPSRFGARWCLGGVQGGGEQVAGREAAVGPPFVSYGEDLLLGGEVAELVGGPDGLTERKVAWQDDVFPVQRDDEGALHGPGTDPGNRGELGHELVLTATPEASHRRGQRLAPDSGDLRCRVSWRTSSKLRPSASTSASTPNSAD